MSCRHYLLQRKVTGADQQGSPPKEVGHPSRYIGTCPFWSRLQHNLGDEGADALLCLMMQDELLRRAVHHHGGRNWKQVGKLLTSVALECTLQCVVQLTLLQQAVCLRTRLPLTVYEQCILVLQLSTLKIGQMSSACIAGRRC